MKMLTITVDTNDADYIERTTIIDNEWLEIIKPVIEAIKNCKENHNWFCLYEHYLYDKEKPSVMYPQLTWNQIDIFNDICPQCEYGFHSIREITLMEVSNIEKLL